MNILSLQTKAPVFNAKNNKEGLPQSLPQNLPPKMFLTETEAKFDEILLQFHRVECDLKTQRQNLRDMYFAQDRFDYRELQKERQRLLARLKRIAKKESKEYYEIESDIAVKKQYNRFLPKVLRAKTPQEKKQVLILMESYPLYAKVKEMLMQLIRQKKGLK